MLPINLLVIERNTKNGGYLHPALKHFLSGAHSSHSLKYQRRNCSQNLVLHQSWCL